MNTTTHETPGPVQASSGDVAEGLTPDTIVERCESTANLLHFYANLDLVLQHCSEMVCDGRVREDPGTLYAMLDMMLDALHGARRKQTWHAIHFLENLGSHHLRETEAFRAAMATGAAS